MTANVLSERTWRLLQDPLLGSGDADAKIRRLLHGEYLRKMAAYHRVDRALRQKYGLTFDEFIAQDIVARQNFSWEVEQDAMDWETAIGGVTSVERRLAELKAAGDA